MPKFVKKLIIVAGTNGSGESTFTKLANFDMPVLNPDAIARRMHPKIVRSVAISAGKGAVRLAENHIGQGRSFVRETTLACRPPVKTVRKAKEIGLETEIIHFGIDSWQILWGRVCRRVLMCAHNIETEDLKRRCHRSLEILKEVAPIADACDPYEIHTDPIGCLQRWRRAGFKHALKFSRTGPKPPVVPKYRNSSPALQNPTELIRESTRISKLSTDFFIASENVQKVPNDTLNRKKKNPVRDWPPWYSALESVEIQYS